KALLPNDIHVCAISARPSTPTARFIRSSVRWNVRLDCYTTIRPGRNATSSMLCSRRLDLDPRRRTHCRDAFAAERWPVSRPPTDAAAAPAKNAGGAYRANRDAVAAKPCADGLRGCALTPAHPLRGVGKGGWSRSRAYGGLGADSPRCADRRWE